MTSRDYVTWWNSRPLLVCNLFRKMMNVVFPSVSHSSTEYPSKLELGIFSLHFYELARWIHGPIEMNRYVLFISEFFFSQMKPPDSNSTIIIIRPIIIMINHNQSFQDFHWQWSINTIWPSWLIDPIGIDLTLAYWILTGLA